MSTHPLRSPNVFMPPERGGCRIDGFLEPPDGLFHSAGISSAASPDNVVGPVGAIGAVDTFGAVGAWVVPTVSK
jgi:hypothetical protein